MVCITLKLMTGVQALDFKSERKGKNETSAPEGGPQKEGSTPSCVNGWRAQLLGFGNVRILQRITSYDESQTIYDLCG